MAMLTPTAPTSFLHCNPPYRAEHVGSLLRPPQLLEKRALFEAGKCSAKELRVAEDEAIAAVLKKQRDAGLQTWTDGEMRRGAFYEGMFEKLEGMETIIRPIETFMAYLPYVQFFIMVGMKEAPSIHCTGRIRRPAGGIHIDDFMYLRSLVSPEEVKNIKVTVCGPTWMHMRHGAEHAYDQKVYKNDESYFADLVQAYREELIELYYLGCRNVQFDDPTFAFFCADSTINGMEKAGVDSEKLFDRYIKLYNDILANRPSDLTVGLHTCRGNYKGLHYCEGGYDRIAPKLLKELSVDCFYLEYDTERSGDLEPLKHLPMHKIVVLGLVTTKSGKLETGEDIEAKIEEAVSVVMKGDPTRSRAYALNQICISPQCGFASVAEGNPVSEEEQWAKLRFVIEVAKRVLE